jgi:hypothetical protein
MSSNTTTTFATSLAGEVVSAQFMAALGEHETPLAHEAFAFKRGAAGSTNVLVPIVGLQGQDLLVARTQGNDTASTTLTSTGVEVAVAPRSLVYDIDDRLYQAADQILNSQNLGNSLVLSYRNSLFDAACSLASSFTAVEGSTGVALDWDDVIDAKNKLAEKGAGGQPLMILHPVQWAQLEKKAIDIAREDGLVGVLSGVGQYKGRFVGVDVFVSNRIDKSGSDYVGMMIAHGAVVIADVDYVPAFGLEQNAFVAGPALIEFERKGTYGKSVAMIHASFGVGVGIDDAGCKLLSKDSY